jgi:hypothetical protein
VVTRFLRSLLGRDAASQPPPPGIALAPDAIHVEGAGPFPFSSVLMLHYGLPLGLGAVVCAVLERPAAPAWEPAPGAWEGEPEKGAFHRGAVRLAIPRQSLLP